MLQFEYADSIFYEKNKLRCENLQEQLISSGFEVKGYCNAWGYEINAFKVDSKEEIKIEKGSNTNGGQHMMVDGTLFHNFTYKGRFKKHSTALKYKSSFLFRYFMDADYKQLIPSPYYIKTNESINYGQINALEKLRNNSDSFAMKIKNGVMEVSFNDKIEDISILLDRIEKIKKSV